MVSMSNEEVPSPSDRSGYALTIFASTASYTERDRLEGMLETSNPSAF